MAAEPTSEIDVGYVARLARIDLTPEETAAFQREIASIVGYVQQLQEVDVTGIEPTAHATQITNVWRQDEPGASLEQAQVLANAPAVYEDLIRVPVVIGGDTDGSA